ncbi:MAG: hypothetical protein ACERJ1_17880 [Halodesulfovibrio sp.]|uniref:hypothetical protein n=1 Tax=Halodesulfovibrio sp. TaxID=1912772 RepID=UPI00359D6DF5
MSESQPAPITTEERLALYLACEKAILNGHQSQTIDGTTYTRADLRTVQMKIKELQYELNSDNTSFTQTPVTFV